MPGRVRTTRRWTPSGGPSRTTGGCAGWPTCSPPAPELAALAPGWVASELVEYSPERSATFRALDATGTAVGYAKAYAPGTVDVAERSQRYARIAAVLAADRTGGSPRRSRSAASRARSVLVLQPMPGVEWGQLAGPALAAAMGRLGSAIATLHAAGPAGDRRAAPVRPARRPPGRAQRAPGRGRAGRTWRPRRSGSPTGSPTARRRAARRSRCTATATPSNALLAGDSIALIDLDQAGVGVAAADLGSLIARLVADGDTGAMRSAFLSGYQAVRPLPPDRSLRWHTAAALVAERAVRAVNRVHLPTLDRLPELLETADDVLLNGVGP